MYYTAKNSAKQVNNKTVECKFIGISEKETRIDMVPYLGSKTV